MENLVGTPEFRSSILHLNQVLNNFVFFEQYYIFFAKLHLFFRQRAEVMN